MLLGMLYKRQCLIIFGARYLSGDINITPLFLYPNLGIKQIIFDPYSDVTCVKSDSKETICKRNNINCFI